LYGYKQARAWRKREKADRQQQNAKSKKSNKATLKFQDVYQTKSAERLKAKWYTTFSYQAETGLIPRRILCKAEVGEEGENIRFVVTNLKTPRHAWIEETIYCGRGQMENYIKDHKLFLHADRTSCHRFDANQFRVFVHSAASVLLHTLRTTGLRGTAWANAQFDPMQIRI
jgi:hypothetical protein